MSKKTLGLKQFLTISDSTARFNFWVGAVRSGKTYSSLVRFADLLMRGPKGDAMICGVSRTTIQMNLIKDLFEILDFPIPGAGVDQLELFGRRLTFVGAKDEGAIGRIRGRTLSLAYIDELTLLPFSVFEEIDNRCSITNAQILATANPAGPKHWMKVKYLDDKKADIKHFKFFLDDNPVLDEVYKNHLRSKNKGMWYKRFVLGEWAAADGLIYDCFDEQNIYRDDPYSAAYHIAGIDYGTSNATCCLLIGIYPSGFGKIRVLKEYYYDSRVTGRNKTDWELGEDIFEFLKSISNLKSVYVDPSALSLRTELERRGLPIYEANNDVVNGIKSISSRIGNKEILIHESCKNLIESLYSYIWNQKAANEGEDKPTKENDHAPDALRYAIFTHFGADRVEDERQEMTSEQLKREMYGYSPMELLHGNL